ncbi:MAG TPA: UvrD-helicase domain-containing protein [Phycisphaerales bacterium]|nr:UvrD-helicase domain-containing protein [Phycisphaerales bacterium]
MTTDRATASVVHGSSPHGLVMASAGTGKTFQLTSRYLLHALRESAAEHAGERADVASILATTFTRKAAGEILERILDRLSLAAMDAAKLAELRQQLGIPLTALQCQTLLASLLRNLDRVSIETIDAFFMRVAKLFALELGITPNWRIAEPQEDDDLREEALDALLEEGDRAELLAQLESLAGGNLNRSVRQAVLNAVGSVYQNYLLADCREEVWAIIGPRNTLLTKQQLDSALHGLTGIALPTTKKGEPNKNWQKAHVNAVLAAGEGDWESFLASGIANKLLDPKVQDPMFSREAIGSNVRHAFAPLINHAEAVLLTRFRDRNLALLNFASRFHSAYEKLKAARGLYLFDDIPRILLQASIQEKLEDVYFRLDASIRHVLLDEFQDTSLLQFSLLLPLLDEILSAEDGRSVFCVGDVKQSLYSWRGAEPGLMSALPGRWESLQPETLERSYRSSQVITDSVNAVFADLSTNAALADRGTAVREWSEGFRPHTTAKKFRGAARLIVAPVDADGNVLSFALAADRVKSILDASPNASVGVLVRANKHIARIIFELKRVGIEASEEGGSPLLDSAPVAVAVSLLQLADFPGDSAAAFHVATSPLGPVLQLDLTPDRACEVSSNIRRRLMADGYANVLRWVLHRTAAHMSERERDRFEQLIDLAQQFDERAGTRSSKFVTLVRSSNVEDPSRNRVRVMSIHKSKGLEFDAVILPDLDSDWRLVPGQCLIDRENPFGPVTLVTRYPNGLLRSLHPRLDSIYERNLDRQVREELSCLYVAMTRAVHHLEMIIEPSAKPDAPLSASGVLRAALAPNAIALPNSELWRSETFQDWSSDLRDRDASESADAPQLMQFSLKSGSGSFVSRRIRLSPSSLEKSASRLDLLFSSRAAFARDQGALLHAWFEKIEWLDESSPADEDVLAIASACGWQHADAVSLLKNFRAMLSDDLGKIFHKSYYRNSAGFEQLELRREWAFETRLPSMSGGEATDLAGRFDRLVLGMDADRTVKAHILDFKSDDLSASDTESIRHAVTNYTPQMNAYVRAAQAMFTLDSKDVTATLVFLKPGVVCNVPMHTEI